MNERNITSTPETNTRYGFVEIQTNGGVEFRIMRDHFSGIHEIWQAEKQKTGRGKGNYVIVAWNRLPLLAHDRLADAMRELASFLDKMDLASQQEWYKTQ